MPSLSGRSRAPHTLSALRLVGFGEIDVRCTDGKIKVQKAVYLCQEALRKANITLDHKFTWYARGPFSPTLSTEYQALADADQWADTPACSDDARAALAPLKPVMSPRNDMNVHGWLELLASLHYMLTRKSHPTDVADEMNAEAADEFLATTEGRFTREQAYAGRDALIEADLL